MPGHAPWYVLSFRASAITHITNGVAIQYRMHVSHERIACTYPMHVSHARISGGQAEAVTAEC